MSSGQQKQYRAGQKRPHGAGTVRQGTQQGPTAAKQAGKTHTVKNNSVNHNRTRRGSR